MTTRHQSAGPIVRGVSAPVCAGFPSPAEDYVESPLDLGRLLVPTGRPPLLHESRADDGSAVVHVIAPGEPARPGNLVLARIDGRPRLARVAGTRRAPVLCDSAGRPHRSDAAEALGVATWRLRGFRGEPLGPAGIGGLATSDPGTFLFRVSGHSMRDAGIADRDLLVVDRRAVPRHGDIVVAVADGARSVKRLLVEGGRARLAFENREAFPDPPPFRPETVVFGVATWGLRRLGAP